MLESASKNKNIDLQGYKKSIMKMKSPFNQLFKTLFFCLMLFFALTAEAQNNAIVASSIPTTTETIKVDGTMGESFWSRALEIPLSYEVKPGNNTQPPVKTIAKVIMGKESLYVFVQAFDNDTQKIRMAFRTRDIIDNDDYIRLGLNTTGKNFKATYFFVSAAGVQSDAAYDQATKKFGFEWNALWTSAVNNYHDKYVVELAIPLNQIRINPNITHWGIQIDRNYPRERPYILSASRRERDSDCIVCDFNQYQIPKIKASKANNGLLIPTVVSKNSRTRDLDNSLDYNNKTKTELGLDFSWKASENMNISATVNPDFSQVEVDELQLGINNQFSLFFEERRNFFNDATDFFSIPGNLFYSRTIVDPDWGLKATGDVGNVSWGVLTAQDNLTNIISPSVDGSRRASLNIGSDVAVFRGINKFSDDFAVGLSLLSRSGNDYFNRVVSTDFNYRLGDSNNFRGRFLASDTEYPNQFLQDNGNIKQPGSDNGYALFYNYSGDNFNAKAEYEKIGNDFRSDNGFVNRVGFYRGKVGGNYTWYLNDDDKDGHFFDQMSIVINVEHVRNTDNQLVDRNFGVSYELAGKWASVLEIGYLDSDALIEQKKISEEVGFVFMQFNPSQLFNFEGSYFVGSGIDFENARQGDIVSWDATIASTIGMHLTLSVAVENEIIKIKGEQLFDAMTYDLRGTWFFNADHSLRVVTRLQDYKQNVALYTFPVDARFRDLSTQLTYRYQINPYTLLFAGYSSGALSNDRFRNFKQNDRTIFLKASYAYGF